MMAALKRAIPMVAISAMECARRAHFFHIGGMRNCARDEGPLPSSLMQLRGTLSAIKVAFLKAQKAKV
jgi:hypothetical protein